MLSIVASASTTPSSPLSLGVLYHPHVSAGFSTLIEDAATDSLDLNTYLVTNSASTFFVKVSGHSMQGAHIQNGDILVVDRSRSPKDKDIVVAALNGELVVKRLKKTSRGLWLCSENSLFPPIRVHGEDTLMIWGVVTGLIHKF